MIEFKNRNQKWVALSGVVILTGFVWLSRSNWLDPIEYLSLDGRFMLRGTRSFPQSIVVIGIDEPSLDALGHWPWPRDKHEALLRLLQHSHFRPAAVAYDILFEHPDPESPQSDEALARQVDAFGDSSIFAYFFEKGSSPSFERDSRKEKFLERFALPASQEEPEGLEIMDKVSLPYDGLLGSSGLGFANNPIDRDGRTRRIRLLSRYQNRTYPSLALLAAIKLMGAEIKDVELKKRAIVIKKSRLGRRLIPITASGDMLINYCGTFREIPKFSFLEILQEGQTWMERNDDPVKLKSLKGKLVLIGATALGLEDRRVTPFQEHSPATNIPAQAVANIIQAKFLKRPPESGAALITVLLGIMVILFISGQTALRSFVFTFSLTALYLLAAYLTFLNDYWIQVAGPLATILGLFVAIISLRYFLTAEELKRTYAQLLHAEKMASLGTLSASIAHEFRNFMSSILMAVEVCQTPNVARSEADRCLDIISSVVRRANQVCQGLLTFARKNESIRKEGRLEQTIDGVLAILGKDLLQHGIQLNKELADVGTLRYDEGQISQVLMNMLRNGRDALNNRSGEKWIAIRLKDLGEKALIEIEDNGSGIPKRILRHLFEPFTTNKKAGEGTGLGLSVCHGIVRNHGGDIKATTVEGKGTTWQIFLPKK